MAQVFLVTFILYFVLHFDESHAATKPNEQKLPVCVIGAGLSGINLGIHLQQKGYDVQIFDKLPTVGGKVDTFTIGNEVLVEMGPILHQPEDNLVQKYIKQFGLTSVPFNQTDITSFDSNTGTIRPYPSPSNAKQQQELRSMVKQYTLYRSQYANQLEFGYLHATSELFDSANAWIIKKNLTPLTPLLELLLTVDGYGSMKDTACLYLLKFISGDLLMVTLNLVSSSLFTLKEGRTVLVNKMASLLKNVNLNHELIAVTRENGRQTISLKNKSLTVKRTCGKTILAFPPLLTNLEKIISDLDSREKSILNQVKIVKFAAAAHHLPPLNRNVYGEGFVLSPNGTATVTGPLGNGEVMGFIKQSSRKMQNVYSSYSWIRGDYNTVPTDSELRQMTEKMNQFLPKLSKQAKTLRALKTFEYFPHVSTASLKNGFYKKFDSIQGNKGLYYASTILTFETMNEALKMAESFVQKYF